MNAPLINPDEDPANKILKAFHEAINANPMRQYTSYLFISHQIAILIDEQLRRIANTERTLQRENFNEFMKKAMET